MNTSHYPSLEICKKLTKIGFPETEKHVSQDNAICNLLERNDLNNSCEGINWYVCPSVMEIFDYLPKEIWIGSHQYSWKISPITITYSSHMLSNNAVPVISTKSIPNALSKMILWLYDNKYISFTK